MENSIQTTGSNAALIPVFSGTIDGQAVQLCCARVLHTFMNVKRDFTTWIKGRIAKFGFVAGEDFVIVENLSSPDLVSAKARTQKLTDYHLTLDMAKELSMVENNAKGREARRYFIACERKALGQQAPTQRPYDPAIDYTRINPAQAQDIKELVHQVVDSGVQTFGETWNRLHNKFRVNSYLELPATKYDEACAYLRGKLPPAPAPAPKPVPAPQPSFITKSVFISPTAIAKCIELRDDGSKPGVSFASNLLGEIQFALMFNGSAAHTRLTVSSAREMGNALLEVANAQAALEQRAALK